MVTIFGTSLADDISVVDDVGESNGTTVPGTIDEIRARQGADNIFVSNSTLAQSVRAGQGNDVVRIKNSDIETVRLGNGDDILTFTGSSITEALRGGNGTDSLNLPAGTVVTDAASTFTVVAGASYTVTVGTFILPDGSGPFSYQSFENGTGVPCFAKETRIAVPGGVRRVEDLRIGDLVMTLDEGPVSIRWIGERRLSAQMLRDNPNLLPIRIPKGALGQGVPEADLVVSPQHRVLVCSVIAGRVFGETQVLLPAKKLVGYNGIAVDTGVDSVTYFHILFDKHQVVWSEGTPTESLYTGPQAMKTLGAEACEEIYTLFPFLRDATFRPDPARPFVQRNKLVANLLRRHVKNSKPLVELAQA